MSSACLVTVLINISSFLFPCFVWFFVLFVLFGFVCVFLVVVVLVQFFSLVFPFLVLLFLVGILGESTYIAEQGLKK